MCIRDVQFSGSVADIRKALAAGTPLHFMYPNEEYLMIDPHPEAHQVRDNDGRKGFRILVNGAVKILAYSENGWKLHCGSTRCD